MHKQRHKQTDRRTDDRVMPMYACAMMSISNDWLIYSWVYLWSLCTLN